MQKYLWTDTWIVYSFQSEGAEPWSSTLVLKISMSEQVVEDRQVMLNVNSACLTNIFSEPWRPQPQENVMDCKG